MLSRLRPRLLFHALMSAYRKIEIGTLLLEVI